MTQPEILPEVVVPGRRLGRHVKHDPRSLRFPFKASSVSLSSHRWSTASTPVLDQGDVGSCTGNSTVAALLCSPLNKTLSTEQVASLDQELAVRIYSRATETDPFPGTYRPNDTGSCGLDVAKAAVEFGYISGYSHAFSLNDALTALTLGPVIIGINWYEGFDVPTAKGRVTPTGELRGGHEVCLDAIDTINSVVWFRNSWTDGWGIRGRACMLFSTLGRLLSEDGDATVFSPLTVAPPTPLPILNADQTLAEETRDWADKQARSPHNGITKAAAASVTKWRNEKGL